MTRAAWPVTVLLVLAGGVAVSVGVGTPARSALGYVGGVAAAVAVVAITSALVALAAVRSPALSLVVALGCYLLTVLGFAVVLIGLDPSLVDTRAVAAGLGAGVLVATVAALRRGTVRNELGGQ